MFKGGDDVTELIEQIEKAGIVPDIVVIDTMARAMVGMNEDSAQDAGILTIGTDRIKRHFKCAVITIHHTGWNKSRPRGSSAAPAAYDARYSVTRKGTSLDVVIENEKQKDGGAWADKVYFTGQEVSFKDVAGATQVSLVFARTTPPKYVAETEVDDARITEVETALVDLGADSKLVETAVLAFTIIQTRLAADPALKKKVGIPGADRMVATEKQRLARNAKDRKKDGKNIPGILRRFVVGEPAGDILWTLAEAVD